MDSSAGCKNMFPTTGTGTKNKSVCCWCLAWLLPWASLASAHQTQETSPKIKVDVALVQLTATVVSRDGRTVPGLKKEDFAIYEDGVRQDIAFFENAVDLPVSVGIVFDTSGSMMDKIKEVQDAMLHFIETTNPEDEIFVLRFSAETFLVQDFTADRQRLRQAIGRLTAQGSTSLNDAIVESLRHIQGGRHKRKALLVITDGNDTSSKIDLEKAVNFAIRSEVPIYALGIGHGPSGSFGHGESLFRDTVDTDALRSFSNLTGGKTFLVRGAHFKGGVDQIDKACQEVSAELRMQYTLGYYPGNAKKDGRYRRIRVEVKGSKLKVRTRDGYFAAPASAASP